MSDIRNRARSARARRTFIVGAAALSLLLTGCGGTRQSDQAIEQAAGVNQAPQGTGAVTDGFGAAPGTVDTRTGAVAAPAGTGAVAADTNAATPGTTTGQTATGTITGGKKNNAGTTASGGNQAPAAGGQAPGPVTPKSVIKLGAVGTFSGPVGGLVKDTVTGIRVWAQAVNASGGVNGHPVEILVGDDGGDPARFNSTLQQFVEQKGVIAFLYTTLGFSPNGNNKYLDSKGIFTFSTEGGLEVAYKNPYVLTATPTGLTNADSMILSFSKAISARGGVKLASFACSDFGLCDNFDQRWSAKDVLDKAGFALVARGRPSLTQPDYTSQCLAAKQAGAEAIIIALDGASIRRFASDCARQNYRPKLATADLVVTGDLPGDKNVDGLFIGTKMAPFMDVRVPGIKEAHAAFASFAPGQKITGGMANGWIIGEFFAQAGRNLPDNPTTKDVEDGLYSIKNNNLKGMTYPITMTRGKPVARQLCYGIAVIEGDKFGVAPGPSLYCEKDGKPLSNPSDYGMTGASVGIDQAAPVRAALRPSAPTAAPSASDWLPQLQQPIVGLVSARPRVMTATPAVAGVPADAATAGQATADTCAPARVAGLSFVLDVLQTGSSAGPSIAYGAALAAIGAPLPEPLGQLQGQLLSESAKSVEQFSEDVPNAVQDLRSAVEPLAAFNSQVNPILGGGAQALDGLASDSRAFVQPGDKALHEIAASLRDAQATDVPC